MYLLSEMRKRTVVLLVVFVLGLFTTSLPHTSYSQSESEQRVVEIANIVSNAIALDQHGTIALDPSRLSQSNLDLEERALLQRFVTDLNSGKIGLVVSDGTSAIVTLGKNGNASRNNDLDVPTTQISVGLYDGAIWIFIDLWWIELLRNNEHVILTVAGIIAGLLNVLIGGLPTALKVLVSQFIANVERLLRYLASLLLQFPTVQSVRILLRLETETTFILYLDSSGLIEFKRCQQLVGCQDPFSYHILLPYLYR